MTKQEIQNLPVNTTYLKVERTINRRIYNLNLLLRGYRVRQERDKEMRCIKIIRELQVAQDIHEAARNHFNRTSYDVCLNVDIPLLENQREALEYTIRYARDRGSLFPSHELERLIGLSQFLTQISDTHYHNPHIKLWKKEDPDEN